MLYVPGHMMQHVTVSFKDLITYQDKTISLHCTKYYENMEYHEKNTKKISTFHQLFR